MVSVSFTPAVSAVAKVSVTPVAVPFKVAEEMFPNPV